jgi:hypothetical protein
MLEQTDAITNDVLEQITFVLAYSTVPQVSIPRSLSSGNIPLLQKICCNFRERTSTTKFLESFSLSPLKLLYSSAVYGYDASRYARLPALIYFRYLSRILQA